MDEVLFAVIAFDDYYPRPNNIEKIFRTREEAVDYRSELWKKIGDYDESVCQWDRVEVIELRIER